MFGLLLAMALCFGTAAFAEDTTDEAFAQVGDWVKSRTTMTRTVTGTLPKGFRDPGSPRTTRIQVKAIKDGLMPTCDITTTIRVPGEDQPRIGTREGDVPFLRDWQETITHEGEVPYFRNRRYQNTESRDGKIKVEVLEEGERTVEVNGVTFEDVFYQKVKMTTVAQGDIPEMDVMIEMWDDGKAPFVTINFVGILKKVDIVTMPTPDGRVETVITTERLAYGRADDPIPGGDEE
jgi:hypothetical protein